MFGESYSDDSGPAERVLCADVGNVANDWHISHKKGGRWRRIRHSIYKYYIFGCEMRNMASVVGLRSSRRGKFN